MGARVIGLGHCMMFFFAYPFNRADAADVRQAQESLEETNSRVLEMGGIPWKAEAPAQKLTLQRMDPNTVDLIHRLRAVLDPQGIMNPGNWEVDRWNTPKSCIAVFAAATASCRATTRTSTAPPICNTGSTFSPGGRMWLS